MLLPPPPCPHALELANYALVAVKEKNPSNGYRVTGSFATGRSTYADLNGSGSVEGADLGMLLATWGTCP